MLRLIVLICFWTIPCFASPPKFLSLKSAFQKFIADSKNANFEAQLKFWETDVESAAPDLYAAFSTGSAQEISAARRSRASKWLNVIIENSDEIISQFDRFEKFEWPSLLRLASLYPEVDFSDVRVAAMPSLMMFDGQVIDVAGHSVVTFGMDFIAVVAKDSAIINGANLVENPAALVAHEFTHVVHQKFSNFPIAGTIENLIDPLWKEGLAEVSSQMLNPGSNLLDVFMEKNLTAKCTPVEIKHWAKTFAADSKVKSEDKLFSNYANWFFTSQSKKFGVPKPGYCLGYNVVLMALRNYSLNELLKMKRADAIDLSEAMLREIVR